MAKIKVLLNLESKHYLKAQQLLPRGTISYCVDQLLKAIVEGRVVTITKEELEREIDKAKWKLNKLESIKRHSEKASS